MGTVKALTRAKGIVRRCAAALYALSPGFLSQLRGKVTILMYHRVVTEAELSSQFIQPGMYVTRDTFDRQVRFLRKHFHVLTMNEFLAMLEQPAWDQGRRFCVITFDDGWLDNYLYALPVLREHETPATIFLPTGMVGTSLWFWPEQLGLLARYMHRLPQEGRAAVLLSLGEIWPPELAAILGNNEIDELIQRFKAFTHERIDELVHRLAETMDVRLPDERMVMNWDEVREMSAAGISFGSHSVSHKILTLVPDTVLHDEVCGSFEELRKRDINTVPVFCYPNGDYSPAVVRCVQAAGYSSAMSTDVGWERAGSAAAMKLKRLGIHNDLTHTESLFAFHLAGFNLSSAIRDDAAERG
jgi:peptidoglycan/xylan/chitin deacetylase (PgdA/CDA1 family)